jgi:hypothetical protein
MKSRQSARPGRKQKPSVVHARLPANRLNATDSFQLQSVSTTNAHGWAAEGVLRLAKGGRENQEKRQLLPDMGPNSLMGGTRGMAQRAVSRILIVPLLKPIGKAGQGGTPATCAYVREVPGPNSCGAAKRRALIATAPLGCRRDQDPSLLIVGRSSIGSGIGFRKPTKKLEKGQAGWAP